MISLNLIFLLLAAFRYGLTLETMDLETYSCVSTLLVAFSRKTRSQHEWSKEIRSDSFSSRFLCHQQAVCQGFCNCSCCLNRRGYRGRAGAFKGVQIRNYLAGAVKGTNLSVKAFLDRLVEDAGGQAVWSTVQGTADTQAILDEVANRQPQKSIGQSTEADEVERKLMRTMAVESERPGRLYGRLKGGDVEVDLASLVGENGAGNGKGKTVDS